MFDIIIFAILTFFIVKKLKSILGEEHDEKMFGSGESSIPKSMKTIINAVVVDNKQAKTDPINDQFKYLNILSQEATRDIAHIIDGFTLEKFMLVSKKVVEIIIEAYNKQDKDKLTSLTSKEALHIFNASIENSSESVDKIVLVSIEDSKIESVELNKRSNIATIKILFTMQQIHYMENKNGDLTSGSKTNINQVKEEWTFERNLSNSKTSTWFVTNIQSK